MAEMRITVQRAITEGFSFAYEIGEGTDIGEAGLNQALDLVTKATTRQKAIFDLPLQEQQLFQCREALPILRKKRAEAVAMLEAHVTRMSANRRGETPPPQSDVNAVAAWDKEIIKVEDAIRGNELLIPHLKAIIAGETPPSLLTEAEPEEFAVPVPMAAE